MNVIVSNLNSNRFVNLDIDVIKSITGEFTVDEKTASYLFAADRCEHIYGKDGIADQISNNKIVISDRYFFSSLAYQSVSCGKELPYLLNSQFPLPQILFYFKINPEVSLKRVLSRSENTEIYEKIEFQKRTAALYDAVINEYATTSKGEGMQIITINAEEDIDKISEKIWNYIKTLPIN